MNQFMQKPEEMAILALGPGSHKTEMKIKQDPCLQEKRVPRHWYAVLFSPSLSTHAIVL